MEARDHHGAAEPNAFRTFRNLHPSTRYTFKVRAYGDGQRYLSGYGPYSALVRVTTEAANCKAPPTAEPDICSEDCRTLLALQSTLVGSGGPTLNWAATRPLSQWTGITASNSGDNVITLNLNSEGLQGTIPAALADLSQLTVLRLHDNSLSGSIPARFTKSFTILDLSNNSLSGSIPGRLGGGSLQFLDLSDNSLTGSLPAEAVLGNVQFLMLNNNRLSGSIPDEWDGLTNAQSVNLASNSFTGAIPEELADLPALTILKLTGNGSLSSACVPGEVWHMVNADAHTLGKNVCLPSFPSTTTLGGFTCNFPSVVGSYISNDHTNGRAVYKTRTGFYTGVGPGRVNPAEAVRYTTICAYIGSAVVASADSALHLSKQIYKHENTSGVADELTSREGRTRSCGNADNCSLIAGEYSIEHDQLFDDPEDYSLWTYNSYTMTTSGSRYSANTEGGVMLTGSQRSINVAPLRPPTGIRAMRDANVDNTLNIAWSAASGASATQLDMRASGVGAWDTKSRSLTGSADYQSGLDCDTWYEVRMRSKRSGSAWYTLWGPWSNSVTSQATTACAPPGGNPAPAATPMPTPQPTPAPTTGPAPVGDPHIPTHLTARLNSDGTVTLNWVGPTDPTVTGYQILRRIPSLGDPTFRIRAADTGTTATTYADPAPISGHRHIYRVKAITPSGLSAWSNYVRVTP